MSKRSSVKVCQVFGEYVEYLMTPPSLMDFLHEDGFDEDWESCGLSIETHLWDLQIALSVNPESGDVIPHSGGLRKLRWALPNSGKRGGARVIYMWIPDIGIVYLYMVYPKSMVDDIKPGVLKLMRMEAEQMRERLIKIYGNDC